MRVFVVAVVLAGLSVAITSGISFARDSGPVPGMPGDSQPSATPTGTPPPGIDIASLPPGGQAAVAAARRVAMAGPGSEVLSATIEDYDELMCGRSYTGQGYGQVWAIVVTKPFEGFVPSLPPGASFDPPKGSMLVAVGSDGISLQTLAPWPVERDPSAAC